MNKSLRIICLATVGLGTMLVSAKAVPTAIELGSAGGSPADPTDETARLVTLVAGYNAGDTNGTISGSIVLAPGAGLPAAPLPAVGTNIGQNSGGGGVQTGLSVDLGTGGYDYVMVKWGDTSEYYYIGGDTGTITVNNDVNGNGESHYDLFDGVAGVPDSANTLALLGFTMIGLVVVARKFRPATVRV